MTQYVKEVEICVIDITDDLGKFKTLYLISKIP